MSTSISICKKKKKEKKQKILLAISEQLMMKLILSALYSIESKKKKTFVFLVHFIASGQQSRIKKNH
jgi:hypothetical protein